MALVVSEVVNSRPPDRRFRKFAESRVLHEVSKTQSNSSKGVRFNINKRHRMPSSIALRIATHTERVRDPNSLGTAALQVSASDGRWWYSAIAATASFLSARSGPDTGTLSREAAACGPQ